ncbi:hypothetical protein [Basilea psittacipulmonis]|uniref:hypothetical protein n=1 Tax=Basilea psittacipulmonis TaxID=1472345 RepID=UPI0005700507|nr:hypothetical protein [Basilea psittacipulmonis]
MFKKAAIALLSVVFLTACAVKENPSELVYKISEQDFMRLYGVTKGIDLCLNPEYEGRTLEDIQSNPMNLTKPQAYLMYNYYLSFEQAILGINNSRTLRSSPAAMRYKMDLEKRLWPRLSKMRIEQVASVLPPAECSAFRRNFEQEAVLVEDLMKRQEREQITRQREQERRKQQALEAYYQTAEGKMELVQQQQLAEQQAMQQQLAQQQRLVYEQLVAQQQAAQLNAAIQQQQLLQQQMQFQRQMRQMNQINEQLYKDTETTESTWPW